MNHSGHKINYIESPVANVFPCTIDKDGDVVVDWTLRECEYLDGMNNEVWCLDCQTVLTPRNSELSDDWEVHNG